MQNIQPIQELAQKHKKRPLSDADSRRVVELLKEFWKVDQSYEQFGHYLIVFSTQVCSLTVLEIIENITENDDRLKFISAVIQSREFDSQPGYIRQLNLIKDLLKNFPELSMLVLMNLSKQVTEGGTKLAPPGLSKKFFELIIDKEDLLSLPWGVPVTNSELTHASVLIVGSLVEGKTTQVNLIRNILERLCEHAKTIIISKHLKKRIENETKLWDPNLKNILRKLGLIENIIDTNQLPSEISMSYIIKDVMDKPVDAKVKVSDQHTDNNLEHASATQFQKIKSLLNELEATTFNTIHEISELKRNLNKSESQLSYIQRRLKENEDELASVLSDKQSLTKRTLELEQRILLLQEQLNQQQKEFETSKNMLMDMNQKESEYAAVELKNKLKKKLRVEYLDFSEIEHEEMTLALGENLRMQLKNIFLLLQKEGINI